MLLVPTYVAQSEIHGLGLFAAEAIFENQPVWIHHPMFDLVLSQAMVDSLPPPAREFLRKYAWIDNDRQWRIGIDNDKYTNHSDDPNCGARKGMSVALRRIEAGEEITEDYRTYNSFTESLEF